MDENTIIIYAALFIAICAYIGLVIALFIQRRKLKRLDEQKIRIDESFMMIRNHKLLDPRSTIFDGETHRCYNSKDEVFQYLSKPEDRKGHFPILIKEDEFVHEYWFRNGVSDDDLELKVTIPNPDYKP